MTSGPRDSKAHQDSQTSSLDLCSRLQDRQLGAGSRRRGKGWLRPPPGGTLSGRQVPVGSGGHPTSARPCPPSLISQTQGVGELRGIGLQGGAPGSV